MLTSTEETVPTKTDSKRIHSKTRGNVHKLPQQLKKRKEEREILPPLSSCDIILQINTLAYCCATGGRIGCFAKKFMNKNNEIVDYNSAIECFFSCRNLYWTHLSKKNSEKALKK